MTERPAGASAEGPVGSGGHPRRLLLVGAVLLALLGCFLRVWALGREPVNADEAVVGLMAEQILHGHFFAFYWGQPYGGGEPYVVAAVFAVLGHSSFTLGLTPVLLDAVAALLTWRLGRRLLSPLAGVLGALLFWVWPEVYVVQSTLEYGFRFVALDCGLGALLVATRLAEPRGRAAPRKDRPARRSRAAWPRWADWALLGLLAGVGWWATPEIAYFLIPAGGLLIFRRLRREIRLRPGDLLVAATAAVVGALPWLWANIGSGFPSLRRGSQQSSSFLEHLRVLVVHVLPTVLGLRLVETGQFVVRPALGWALYVLAGLAGLAWLVRLVRHRRALVLVTFVVVFPFLYAYSPFTWYWQDARYALYLAPVLALLAAAAAEGLGALLASRLDGRGRAGGRAEPALALSLPVALVAAALALSLGAMARLGPYAPGGYQGSPRGSWTSWTSDPTGFLSGIARGLERAHLRYVYAGYWTAYPLALQSHGRLVVAPLGPDYSRYAPFLEAVEQAGRPAWLFARPRSNRELADRLGSSELNPACVVMGEPCLEAGAFMVFLRARHLGFTVVPLGAYQAVVPDRPLSPVEVLQSLGLRS